MIAAELATFKLSVCFNLPNLGTPILKFTTSSIFLEIPLKFYIKKNMINVMQSGSIIYDLAASQGGNSELTKVNEVVDNNGVKIMGEANILNKLPTSASNLYAKNMFNFVSNLFNKEKKSFEINLEDEIIKKTMIT